jgi:hypothetical protein
LAHVDCVLYAFFAASALVTVFSAAIGPNASEKEQLMAEQNGFVPMTAASRKLVSIELERFRGFGCSECEWRFKPSGAPTGTSFDEMLRNFTLQRDREFSSHLCADHPRIVGVKPPI